MSDDTNRDRDYMNAVDEIERLERERDQLKAIVDNYCSRHDLKSCACEFGDDSDEPISECDYHKARSRKLVEMQVRWAGCEATNYDLRKERDSLTVAELVEAKSDLAAAERGHDAAHAACVKYDAELAEARGHIHKLIDLAEFWISHGAGRSMSEQEYKTWMSLGFQSNAYRNARAFLNKQTIP